MTLTKKIWLALSVAYFALLNQFYMIFGPLNRYSMRWRLIYLIEIITAIVILALCFLGFYLLVRIICVRYTRLKPAGQILILGGMWFFLIRAASSMLVYYPETPVWLLDILASSKFKMALYALVIPLTFWIPGIMRRLLAGAYFIMSPLLIMTVLLGFSYPVHAPPESADLFKKVVDEHVPSSSDGTDVFVFIFDGWSADRTFRGQKARDDMPNLQRFMNTATTWLQAYSPGDSTLTSIPRMLYASNPGVQSLASDRLTSLIYNHQFAPTGSIFSIVPSNYLKFAVGVYNNYPEMLAGDVDFGARMDDPNVGFWPRVSGMLMTQVAWLRHFGLIFEITPLSMVPRWEERLEEVHRMALYTIEKVQSPVWAWFHYALPHEPFIWGPEGRVVDPPWDIHRSVEGYESNLAGLDYFIGLILNSFHDADRFDRSLIVFTSDHSWIWDPDQDMSEGRNEPFEVRPRRHVPLVIKRPYQRTAEVVYDVVSLTSLPDLLKLEYPPSEATR